MGGTIGGAAPGLSTLLGRKMEKRITDLESAVDSPESTWGLESKNATAATMGGRLEDGHMYFAEAMGFEDNLPRSTRPLNAAGTLTHSVDKKYAEWSLAPKAHGAQISFNGFVMRVNEVDQEKDADIVMKTVENFEKDVVRQTERQMWGNGSGELAVVDYPADSGATAIQIKRADCETLFRNAGYRGARPFITEGRVVVPINPATGARIGSQAYLCGKPFVKKGTDYDEVPVSPALDADLLPGTILVAGDATRSTWQRESDGADVHYDCGVVRLNYNGIDRAVFEKGGTLKDLYFRPVAAEGSADHFHTIDRAMLTIALDQLEAYFPDEKVWEVRCAKNTWREMLWQSEIRTRAAGGAVNESTIMNREQQGGRGMGAGEFYDGARSFTFQHDTLQVRVVLDPMAPPNTVLIRKPGQLRRYWWQRWQSEKAYGPKMKGGMSFLLDPLTNKWASRWTAMYSDIAIEPSKSAWIKQIAQYMPATASL